MLRLSGLIITFTANSYYTAVRRFPTILTPNNDTATSINGSILNQFPTEIVKYQSVDSMVELEDVVHYSVEFHRVHKKIISFLKFVTIAFKETILESAFKRLS